MRRSEWLLVTALAACASTEQEGKTPEGPIAVVDVGTPASAAPATDATSTTRTAPRPPESFALAKDLAVATDRANREQRPMFLYFCAAWAVACKELDKVFASPRFMRAASRYVGVKVDMTDDESTEVKRMQTEFRLRGVPTILLIGVDGIETFRTEQFEPEETWVARLEQLR